MKLEINYWYRFMEPDNNIYVGQYVGRQKGFECCVCGKGSNTYTFNIWNSETDYETWGYGKEHLPEILEDLGNYEGIIVNNW